mgnify:CR=1 FL=1
MAPAKERIKTRKSSISDWVYPASMEKGGDDGVSRIAREASSRVLVS